MNEDDPLQEFFKRFGVPLRQRDAPALEQMLATGLGSLAGQGLARLAGLGWLGIGLSSLAGAALGHVAVRYRLDCEEQAVPRPEGR